MSDTNIIMRQIMQQEPSLTASGFNVANDTSESMFDPMNLTSFEKARIWLGKQKKTKHINLNTSSSYGLKHIAEKDIGYITNGMFIAAAIAEGFDIQKAGPNAYFNISRRLITVNVMDC